MSYSLPPVNLTNSTAGLEQLVIYEAGQIPILVPLMLFFIYISILAGGYFSQQRRLGKGSFPMWSAIAGYVTTSGAMVLFMIQGIINLETLVILFIITIACTMWFLLTRDEF